MNTIWNFWQYFDNVSLKTRSNTLQKTITHTYIKQTYFYVLTHKALIKKSKILLLNLHPLTYYKFNSITLHISTINSFIPFNCYRMYLLKFYLEKCNKIIFKCLKTKFHFKTHLISHLFTTSLYHTCAVYTVHVYYREYRPTTCFRIISWYRIIPHKK